MGGKINAIKNNQDTETIEMVETLNIPKIEARLKSYVLPDEPEEGYQTINYIAGLVGLTPRGLRDRLENVDIKTMEFKRNGRKTVAYNLEDVAEILGV